MITTTAGRLWLSNGLPAKYRDNAARLDSKGVSALLDRVAREDPEDYPKVVKHMLDVGRSVAFRTGGYTFGLKALRRPAAAVLASDQIRTALSALYADPRLDQEQKRDAAIDVIAKAADGFEKKVYDEALADNNPIALQVLSGSRGKPSTLQTLIGGDLLYQDSRGRPIPVPVLRSYAQGLTPAQYFAGAYGARTGVIGTKLMTANAGFLGKQLVGAAHRLVTGSLDHDETTHGPDVNAHRGLPVETSDSGSVGSLLARDAGGYKRNTVITGKILRDLRDQGLDRVLVRSPIASNSHDGSIYGRDLGVRERGGIPAAGDQVGIAAAQAVGEIVSQSSLGSKHGGGVSKGVSQGPTGFKLLNLLAQAPKGSPFWAAHAGEDGAVKSVNPSPAGGWVVRVGNSEHHVPPTAELRVKEGDRVEAGDLLSSGLPDPNELVRHLGVGEARRRFMTEFRKAVGAGATERRNLELVSRGLINHVKMTDQHDDWLPDDVVPYDVIERSWKPREDAAVRKPQDAVGRYLEAPVMHYSVGTHIKPSVAKELQHFGIESVTAHDKPPPFQPHFVRAMENLQNDPDAFVRHMGSNIQKTTLKAVHRGETSDENSTSFVPSLMRGKDFGKTGPVKSYAPPEVSKVL